MKDSALGYILLIVALIGTLHAYDIFHNKHLTIERAMSPVRHLSNAREYIIDSDYNRSIRQLEAAIMDMQIIEQYADSSATHLIEKAIADLKLVEAEVQNDSVIVSDLNRAYFNALNSIAFANLTIAEESLEKGEKYKAMRFLNETSREMVSSLSYAADEESKVKEKKAISDIRKILSALQKGDESYTFDYDSINQEMEELIEP